MLDAFEIVFLVVPLVMPPVLAVVDDPAWVAALTLLVLQAGFLLPPFGYAVVMARSMIARSTPLPALARALRPHLVMQAALIVAVLAWPQTTRWMRPADAPAAAQSPALDEHAFDVPPREVDDAASTPEPSFGGAGSLALGRQDSQLGGAAAAWRRGGLLLRGKEEGGDLPDHEDRDQRRAACR